MAERDEPKVADHADIALDDPFAELTRIMGFDPRRTAAAPAATRPGPAPAVEAAEDDFGIDMERELMGEFDADQIDVGSGNASERPSSISIEETHSEPDLEVDFGAEFDAAVAASAVGVVEPEFAAEGAEARPHQADEPVVGEGFDVAAEIPEVTATAALVDREPDATAFDLDADEFAKDFERALGESREAGDDLVDIQFDVAELAGEPAAAGAEAAAEEGPAGTELSVDRLADDAPVDEAGNTGDVDDVAFDFEAGEEAPVGPIFAEAPDARFTNVPASEESVKEEAIVDSFAATAGEQVGEDAPEMDLSAEVLTSLEDEPADTSGNSFVELELAAADFVAEPHGAALMTAPDDGGAEQPADVVASGFVELELAAAEFVEEPEEATFVMAPEDRAAEEPAAEQSLEDGLFDLDLSAEELAEPQGQPGRAWNREGEFVLPAAEAVLENGVEAGQSRPDLIEHDIADPEYVAAGGRLDARPTEPDHGRYHSDHDDGPAGNMAVAQEAAWEPREDAALAAENADTSPGYQDGGFHVDEDDFRPARDDLRPAEAATSRSGYEEHASRSATSTPNGPESSLEDELNALLGNFALARRAVETRATLFPPAEGHARAAESSAGSPFDDLRWDIDVRSTERTSGEAADAGAEQQAEAALSEAVDAWQAKAGNSQDDIPDFDDADFERAMSGDFDSAGGQAGGWPVQASDSAGRPKEDPLEVIAAMAARYGASAAPAAYERATVGVAAAGSSPEPRAKSAGIGFAGLDFSQAPEIETVEVADRAVALADDLDLPELHDEQDVRPAYDDFDGDFANLLNDMNVGEMAQPEASAQDSGDHRERSRDVHGSEAGEAAGQQAPARHSGYEDEGDPFALDVDNLPGARPVGEDDVDDYGYDVVRDPMAVPAAAEPQQRRRGVLVAGVVGAVALAGAVGGFALSFGNGSGGDLPAIVRADDAPVKVKPENPGGTTVPNQDSEVYETVAGGSRTVMPQQDKLVTTAEEPIEVSLPVREAYPAIDLAPPQGETAGLVLPADEPADLAPPEDESTDLALPEDETAGLALAEGETEDLASPAGETAERARPDAETEDLVPSEGETEDMASLDDGTMDDDGAMNSAPLDEIVEDFQPKSEDRIEQILQQAEEADGNNGITAVAPRKVRTMIVRPDGTLVPRDEEPAQVERLAAAAAEATSEVSAPTASDAGTVAAPAAEATPTMMPMQEKTGPGAEAPASDVAAAEIPVAAEAAETVVVEQETATGSPSMPEIAPIAPQRPSEQPVEVVGEVKPDRVAAVASTPSSLTANATVWSMQIASQPSEAAARSSYQDLAKRYDSVLGGREVNIVKAEITGRGTFWRVRVPASSRNDAIELCESYKAAGGNCFVSR